MPATRARKTQGGSFRENRSGAGAAQGLGSVGTPTQVRRALWTPCLRHHEGEITAPVSAKQQPKAAWNPITFFPGLCLCLHAERSLMSPSDFP